MNGTIAAASAQPNNTVAPEKTLTSTALLQQGRPGSAQQKLTDDHLFKLCKRYGENVRYWRQKFAGLLPEVNKRRLYEKKGFSSISHFAKVLAGMSEEQVRLVLNLEKRFEDKPSLKSLLVNGEVSVHKLARVVSIATSENQENLAEQAKVLSQSALETLVRDEKFAQRVLEKSEAGGNKKQGDGHPSFENQNGLQKPLFDDKSLRAQTHTDVKLMANLSSEVKTKLLELIEKGIDVNELILEMLEKRKAEIQQEKEKLSEQAKPTSSRYIKVDVRKLIQKEYGTKCSIRSCSKQAINIHHSQRFSLSGVHDPKYLAPVCKDHHDIAHSIDRKYHAIRQAAINSS